MTEAERLNRILAEHAPAVHRCLSPLGRRAAFPKGIPYQSSMARGTAINATIGQMTDGAGCPLPLDVMDALIAGLDRKKMFLYAPVEGHRDVREAWRTREQRLGGSTYEVALPITTHGLTHGLACIADLFADPETTVIVPQPHWGNYRLIFTLHSGAQLDGFPFFAGDGFNLDGLAATLERVTTKAILVLNLPGNPTGYALTPAEAEALCTIVAAHPYPLVVVVDDAYQGFIYEDDRHSRSIFWDLAEVLDPECHTLFKIDGATKELLFFSSRLGFVTHPYDGPAEDALLSKFKYLIRGTVGSPPGPSQAMVLAALRHPRLEEAVEARREEMRRRYVTLRDAVASIRSARLRPLPFNAAFFMMMEIEGMDADLVRRRLIEEQGVGTIAFAEPNALRVAYCSVAEGSIPELIDRIERVVES